MRAGIFEWRYAALEVIGRPVDPLSMPILYVNNEGPRDERHCDPSSRSNELERVDITPGLIFGLLRFFGLLRS